MLVVHLMEQSKSLTDQGNVKFDRAKCSRRDSFDVLRFVSMFDVRVAHWVDVYILCYGRQMPSSLIFHPGSLPWHSLSFKILLLSYPVFCFFLTKYVIPCLKVMSRSWVLCTARVLMVNHCGPTTVLYLSYRSQSGNYLRLTLCYSVRHT